MSQMKIFVSYAHDDFRPRPGFNQSRVGQILDDLRYDLKCDSSRARFKILRDAENLLRAADPIHATLKRAMEQCDAAMLFLSESYLASEECLREFRFLLESGKPLFIVEVEDIWSCEFVKRLAEQQRKLREILATQFWGVVDGRKVRYGWPLPQADTADGRRSYQEALDRLTESIRARASELLERPSDEPGQKTSKCAVFLAYPTGDVKHEALRLQKTLEAEGHAVLAFDPKLDVPTGATPEEAIEGLVKRCDLFVQLLGGIPGGALAEGAALRRVPGQYKIAEGLGVQIQTWRKPDFDIADCDPDYGQFLNGLTSHVAPFEEFEHYVTKKLADIFAARQLDNRRGERIEKQASSAQRPLMAIDVAKSDNELARKIASAFSEFVDVETLAFDLDRNELEDAISINDAVILCYGASDEGQKRANSHFKIIRKRRADVQAKRLELAVGDAAPPTAPPAPSGPDIPVIAVREEVDRSAMMRFLERLGVPARVAA
jgi:hypothetical protein